MGVMLTGVVVQVGVLLALLVRDGLVLVLLLLISCHFDLLFARCFEVWKLGQDCRFDVGG